MIIDSHAHVILPFHRQVELMHEANIDLTILFTTTIHPEIATDLDSFEKEMQILDDILAGRKNPSQERLTAINQIKEAITKYPGKYIGFGSMPMGLTFKESANWVEQYIVANGFYGIGEMAPGSGQISKLEPVFAASAELGNLPLWVHTFFPLNFDDITELLSIAKQYPTVPLILGHMGGIYWRQTLKLVKDIPNIYLDLSATFTTIAPTIAIQELPHRTLFSSDAPYTTPAVARTIIEHSIKDKYILERVLGANIAELLGI